MSSSGEPPGTKKNVFDQIINIALSPAVILIAKSIFQEYEMEDHKITGR